MSEKPRTSVRGFFYFRWTSGARFADTCAKASALRQRADGV